MLRNSLYKLNKLSARNKLLARSCPSRTVLGAGMVVILTMSIVTLAASSLISPASANCAFGGECKADRHTATGDANNPKSWKNTETADTRDKCFPNKQTCP